MPEHIGVPRTGANGAKVEAISCVSPDRYLWAPLRSLLQVHRSSKMLSLSLISSAILLGVANGKPTPLEALDQLAEKQTFSLQTIEVDRKEPRSLLDEITHTYMKYNVEPPSYIEAAVRDTPGAGVATTPAKSIGGDKEYLISVQVGNHNLTLDPDTGSADLYVAPVFHPRC